MLLNPIFEMFVVCFYCAVSLIKAIIIIVIGSLTGYYFIQEIYTSKGEFKEDANQLYSEVRQGGPCMVSSNAS